MPPDGRQCALECDYVRRLAKLAATRMDPEYDATPLDLPPGKSEVATRLDLHCRPLCGKSFGAQCGQHLRPRTEAVRWSSTRVCMIDELTATLTATRSTISPSTKIITHNLPPNRNHGGPSRTLRMDLRIRRLGFRIPPGAQLFCVVLAHAGRSFPQEVGVRSGPIRRPANRPPDSFLSAGKAGGACTRGSARPRSRACRAPPSSGARSPAHPPSDVF